MKLLNSLTFSFTTSATGSFLYIILDNIYNKNVNKINKYPRSLEDWKIGYFFNYGFLLGGAMGLLYKCPFSISTFLGSKPKIE